MKFFYPRIKDLRQDHDLSQKDVAAILKTTQQQYGKYERGDREIPIHHLITLADFYNTSIDYLVSRTKYN